MATDIFSALSVSGDAAIAWQSDRLVPVVTADVGSTNGALRVRVLRRRADFMASLPLPACASARTRCTKW